jgi:hypothetical protein
MCANGTLTKAWFYALSSAASVIVIPKHVGLAAAGSAGHRWSTAYSVYSIYSIQKACNQLSCHDSQAVLQQQKTCYGGCAACYCMILTAFQ